MEALKNYLIEARKFNTPKLRAIYMGNTSADMDSVVSSMLLSWLYSTKSDFMFTPVIYCTIEEFPYRMDIVAHLANFGIDMEFLKANCIFKDDFAGKVAETFGSVESVGLTDFNKLTKECEATLKGKIHYIVDHHNDNNLYADTTIEREI
jgi:inorganic pyrophosphatase/exopolyphosphatase